MKKDKFLEAMENIDDDLLERAQAASVKKKSSALKKVILIAAVITLVSVLAVSIVIGNSVSSGGAESDSESKDTESVNTDQPIIDSAYWQDTRERNGKSAIGAEYAIEWPWNCRAVYNQYTTLKMNGVTYEAQSSYYGISVDADRIGEKIGDFTCEGYDYYEEQKHTTNCAVYEIKGMDGNRFVAVKYEGHEGFYPFKHRMDTPDNAPKTLGALIDTLDLTTNIKLTNVYCAEKGGDVRYALSEESSSQLWEIIKRYAQTPLELDYSKFYGSDKAVSFSLNSDVLGVKNLSFSFNEEGYLFTNIESFGYYYNVGMDAVEQIVDFVLKNRTKASEDETQYLVGTVTEIGENYIKVDDSIVMKNPEDGIEFTVFADHMNIKRYIISGHLQVGATVSIKHGYLPKENYIEIRNAIELEECIITSSGEVLIPE